MKKKSLRSRGSLYAVTALKLKRATIASEIVATKRKLRHLQDSLVHVDATLRILNPSIDPEAIPNKRRTKRVKLFRQGELSRSVLNVIRKAPGPISAPEITTALLADGGHGEAARQSVSLRVRGTLLYLRRRGIVTKSGEQRKARWVLAERSAT